MEIVKKFQGVLLASDFDGTLIDEDGNILQEDLDAVRGFINRGGVFTVATGRARRAFLKEYPRLTLNAPAVISNGAVIYDFEAGRPAVQTILGPTALPDFTRLSESFPDMAMEIYSGDTIYAHNYNEVTRIHLEHVGAECIHSHISKVPLPWTNLLLEQERPMLEAAREFIAERFPGRYEAVFSNAYLLEVTAPGGNKGGAVLKLADMLGIKNIYCVGDNENDVPMLKAATLGFAPENATPEAKAAANRVVSSCRNGCIRDVIGILDTMY